MRLSTLILLAGVSLASDAAYAFPAAPLGTVGPHVTQVRDRCGWGAHQGRFGGCRLNNGWRGRMRGAMGGAPLGCPPETHPTGRGFCRTND